MSAHQSQYTVRSFDKDEVIFTEGQIANCAYLVVSGSICIYKVVDTERAVLDRLKQGQIFGEMAIISGEPRTANAMATEDSSLAIIERETLKHAMQESPQITQAMTKALIARLMNTTKKFPSSHPQIF